MCLLKHRIVSLHLYTCLSSSRSILLSLLLFRSVCECVWPWSYLQQHFFESLSFLILLFFKMFLPQQIISKKRAHIYTHSNIRRKMYIEDKYSFFQNKSTRTSAWIQSEIKMKTSYIHPIPIFALFFFLGACLCYARKRKRKKGTKTTKYRREKTHERLFEFSTQISEKMFSINVLQKTTNNFMYIQYYTYFTWMSVGSRERERNNDDIIITHDLFDIEKNEKRGGKERQHSLANTSHNEEGKRRKRRVKATK